MWKIVRRAKQVLKIPHHLIVHLSLFLSIQCLDFSVTMFFLFFVVCFFYGGLPHSWAWWLTHLASTAITALTAEYLCMRSELAAIPLSAGSLRRT